MRVKCLAQEHDTVFLAKAQTQTSPSRDKHTNHDASLKIKLPKIKFYVSAGTTRKSCTCTGQSDSREEFYIKVGFKCPEPTIELSQTHKQ